ncbi:carbohydrate ABC transporter permease [Clostridium sp. SYSU_GA19001]|uniref:carbohydrate ABC transporter permease n=1 Tax=Clostridium caldaquaticum TaxID=2940653 RepID=UPI00207733DE|nr:carbohydrate ABC transporter permease [Clostridium caldaquaticum]MCM8711573.1 carbohydrate ABC transporter permease [Clostridium caldaquaticum]
MGVKAAKRIKAGLVLVLSTILLLLYLYPFFMVLVNSLKKRAEIIKSPLTLGENINFKNYTDAFRTMNFMNGFFNSLIITVVSVSLIIIFSAMLAYFLARWNWKINKLIFVTLVVSMIIPFQALMIPFVKIYGSLNLLNSKWMLCFFYLGFGLSLATFMYHGFITSIPVELEEAAIIDGASPIQVFFKIILPLLKTTTITIAILDVLWIWNDFLLPSLVLIGEDQRTLPLSMFYFFGKYTSDYGMAMAALILTIIPVIIFYLLMQKQIIKGVIEGAIK